MEKEESPKKEQKILKKPEVQQVYNKIGLFYRDVDDNKLYLYKSFMNKAALEHFLKKDKEFEKVKKKEVVVTELK